MSRNNNNNNNCFISIAVQWPTVKFESHWMRSTLSYDRETKQKKKDIWLMGSNLNTFLHSLKIFTWFTRLSPNANHAIMQIIAIVHLYLSIFIYLPLSLVSLGRANFHKRHEAPNFQKKTFHFGQQIFSFCLSFFSLFPLLSFSVTGANIIF